MPERQAAMLALLTSAAEWVEPVTGVTDCADPNDNKYLELALAFDAAAIVSSDNHLLSMNPWRGIPILRAAEFLLLS
jgi:putative PIN family toxin of toxin-antitoxin system